MHHLYVGVVIFSVVNVSYIWRVGYYNTYMYMYNNTSHSLLHVNSSVTLNLTCTNKEDDEYNSRGALIFIIAVLVIYGSSIIAFIAYSIKSSRLSTSSIADKEVEKFLNNQDELHRGDAVNEVRYHMGIFLLCLSIEENRITLSNIVSVKVLF